MLTFVEAFNHQRGITIYIYVYKVQSSPSRCVRREVPGVTQVDEKGHEGNTAVVTAYHFNIT